MQRRGFVVTDQDEKRRGFVVADQDEELPQADDDENISIDPSRWLDLPKLERPDLPKLEMPDDDDVVVDWKESNFVPVSDADDIFADNVFVSNASRTKQETAMRAVVQEVHAERPRAALSSAPNLANPPPPNPRATNEFTLPLDHPMHIVFSTMVSSLRSMAPAISVEYPGFEEPTIQHVPLIRKEYISQLLRPALPFVASDGKSLRTPPTCAAKGKCVFMLLGQMRGWFLPGSELKDYRSNQCSALLKGDTQIPAVPLMSFMHQNEFAQLCAGGHVDASKESYCILCIRWIIEQAMLLPVTSSISLNPLAVQITDHRTGEKKQHSMQMVWQLFGDEVGPGGYDSSCCFMPDENNINRVIVLPQAKVSGNKLDLKIFSPDGNLTKHVNAILLDDRMNYQLAIKREPGMVFRRGAAVHPPST
jgi:hypothetical protein